MLYFNLFQELLTLNIKTVNNFRVDIAVITLALIIAAHLVLKSLIILTFTE